MLTKSIIKLPPGLYILRKDKESLLSEIGVLPSGFAESCWETDKRGFGSRDEGNKRV